MAGEPEPRIVDLGCGTGSNLRATAPLLGPRQSWTLVDYDARLLTAARERLCAWADRVTDSRIGVILHKGRRAKSRCASGRPIWSRDLDAALGEAPDLVTASALFDLCSAAFIERFAAAVAGRKAAFFTVLTYDGVQNWTPAHPADAAMRAAFIAHQQTDKGFGVSAGPDAPKRARSGVRQGRLPGARGEHAVAARPGRPAASIRESRGRFCRRGRGDRPGR